MSERVCCSCEGLVRLTIRPNGYSTRRQLFDARVADRLVMARSATPLLDACRVLLAEGTVTPETRVAMRHEGDALISTVGAGRHRRTAQSFAPA
jgi:hypothetical protein